jgi:hypothetical protein
MRSVEFRQASERKTVMTGEEMTVMSAERKAERRAETTRQITGSAETHWRRAEILISILIKF